MTTYHIGPGGDDTADGLTWKTRWLNLQPDKLKKGDMIFVGGEATEVNSEFWGDVFALEL